jgi:hypothetical protein
MAVRQGLPGSLAARVTYLLVRDHTVPQVVAGSILGAAAAFLAYAAIAYAGLKRCRTPETGLPRRPRG